MTRCSRATCCRTLLEAAWEAWWRREPGRGRGRPRLMAEDAIDLPALPSDPLIPIDRRPFDYSDLATG